MDSIRHYGRRIADSVADFVTGVEEIVQQTFSQQMIYAGTPLYTPSWQELILYRGNHNHSNNGHHQSSFHTGRKAKTTKHRTEVEKQQQEEKRRRITSKDPRDMTASERKWLSKHR